MGSEVPSPHSLANGLLDWVKITCLGVGDCVPGASPVSTCIEGGLSPGEPPAEPAQLFSRRDAGIRKVTATVPMIRYQTLA